MTARVHIHLHVTDLARSRDFYEKLFGTRPVKDLEGYTKFLPDFAAINLALSPGGKAGSDHAAGHLGVQLDTMEEVMAHLDRVRQAGLPVRTEMGVDCCHANQDKFWVRDPDGLDWEIYHLNYDLDPAKGLPKKRQLAGFRLPMAQAPGCCAR